MKMTVLVVAGLALAALPFALGQVVPAKLTTEPDPSFAEDAVSNHRHPDVDTDVYLYINHWRNSLPDRRARGVHRARYPDARRPAAPGQERGGPEIHQGLQAGGARAALLDPVVQERQGAGVPVRLRAARGGSKRAGRAADLEEGMAVVLPAGLAYRFINPHDANFETIMVVEEVPAGFVPNDRMSVGDYRVTVPSVGMHWAHIGRGFTWDTPPKFANPMGFAAVSIDKFDIAQPHVHGPGCEEIWCQLHGTSLLLFGNRLMRQEPGEAFLVPPNRKVPHSSINPTDGPMLWLYMGNRHDQVK